MSKMGNQIFAALLLLTVNVMGQDITVRSAFDTSRILIGDQIHYSVVVEQPADIELSLPLFRDTINKHIEILSGPLTDTSSISAERIRITEKYLITSFDSGFYKVSPVYAEINSPNGLKRFYSDYSVLEVSRVRLTPPDTSAGIFDIAAPYKAPLTLGEVLPWIIILLIISAAVWMAIRFINKYKRRTSETVEPILAEPAHVIAFRELETLREEKLWQNGETKKFYTRLTDILRQYLENRFQIYSLELTTSETLEELVKTGFKKNETYNKLRNILNSADLVKFARYKPDPVENDTGFSNAWDFVDATKAVEVIEIKDDFKVNGKEESV
jgi:hypothetical protein